MSDWKTTPVPGAPVPGLDADVQSAALTFATECHAAVFRGLPQDDAVRRVRVATDEHRK